MPLPTSQRDQIISDIQNKIGQKNTNSLHYSTWYGKVYGTGSPEGNHIGCDEWFKSLPLAYQLNMLRLVVERQYGWIKQNGSMTVDEETGSRFTRFEPYLYRGGANPEEYLTTIKISARNGEINNAMRWAFDTLFSYVRSAEWETKVWGGSQVVGTWKYNKSAYWIRSNTADDVQNYHNNYIYHLLPNLFCDYVDEIEPTHMLEPDVTVDTTPNVFLFNSGIMGVGGKYVMIEKDKVNGVYMYTKIKNKLLNANTAQERINLWNSLYSGSTKTAKTVEKKYIPNPPLYIYDYENYMWKRDETKTVELLRWEETNWLTATQANNIIG